MASGGIVSDNGHLIQRDLLVSALFSATDAQGSTAALLRADNDSAVFILQNEKLLAVLASVEESEDPGSVERRVGHLVRARAGSALHVVLVGGGPVEQRCLAKAVPSSGWKRATVTASRVDGTWRVHSVRGSPPPILSVALRELRERAPSMLDRPLTPEALQRMTAPREKPRTSEERFHEVVESVFPWATIAIATLCVSLHGLALFWGRDAFSVVLWRLGANSREQVLAGEWWRLISSAFLHGGFFHLAANMLVLASFGPFLEQILGRSRFVVLYVISGLAGSLASIAFRGEGMSVGASGAIWGLMAAGAAFARWPRGLFPPPTLAKLKRDGIAPVLANLAYSFAPGIDLFAHLGGGIAGFAMIASGLVTRGLHPSWGAAAWQETTVPLRVARVGWGVAATLSTFCVTVCVATAIVVDSPWEVSRPRLAERTRLGVTEISMRPPRVLGAMVVEMSVGEPFTDYRFGAFDRDPIAMQLRLTKPLRLDELPPDDAALASWLRSLLDKLDNKDVPEAKSGGATRTEPLGSGIVAVRDFEFPNGVHLRTLARLVERRVVIVTFASVLPESTAWMSLASEVIASVQAG